MSYKALKKRDESILNKSKTGVKSKIILEDLYTSYKNLELQNEQLITENNELRDLIIKNSSNYYQSSVAEKILSKSSNIYRNINLFFYIQIILGILVIVLSLGFHIVYLAVTSCLMYTNGNPDCWFQNWFGNDIHASFFIDLVLYSIIFIQSILIIFIIRNRLLKKKFELNPENDLK